MSCDSPRTVHTVGHSTRTIDALIELQRAHAIELLVDVRRWPASRRYPHFNRALLAASLKASDIDRLPWHVGLWLYNKLVGINSRQFPGHRIDPVAVFDTRPLPEKFGEPLLSAVLLEK